MRKLVLVTAALVGVLLCRSLLRATADVVTLNADTFADKVKEKDTLWFVKFCVPWCKHCKNLGSLWEDLERNVEGEDGIEIGEVDCSTNKPICTKVDIHSYPTFKLFYEGEEIAKYKGPRDVESLKAFALEEAVKASKGEYDSDKSSL
ncbi:protein disulfide isomerase-like 5-1 isoform X2 [Nymphaea colorata]|uniref:protein disulfide isomerase-like 5-1 isoform X2 n=1 Tax=Nymphaea colorata TaxID=210225 RepID=UPI00129DCC57|nr:protein disulfide isomerase-like 5-1 isoform X2 [Nymphaea colorata]